VRKKVEREDKQDKQALIFATLAVAFVSALFIFPLPPSWTFFDGLGRISLMYGVAATCLWVFMARKSRMFMDTVLGSVLAVFFGTVLGLFFEYLLSLVEF